MVQQWSISPPSFTWNVEIKIDLPDEGEIKADRELEVKLDCGALMVSADGVLDLNVDLRRGVTDDPQWASCSVTVRHCRVTWLTFGP